MHMNDGLQSEMLEATRLTRAGRLTEATARLQRVLRGGTAPDTASGPTGDAGHALAGGGRITDLTPDTVELATPQQSPPAGQASATGVGSRPATSGPQALHPHLPEALRGFLDRVKRSNAEPQPGGLAKRSQTLSPDVVPDGGRFLAASYGNQAGSRAYKVYKLARATIESVVVLGVCAPARR
jgi:hypothetical protein